MLRATIGSASLSEVGYFDIYPGDNNASFNAAWHNYPYYPSGLVVVSGIEQGMFVLRPDLPPPPVTDDSAYSLTYDGWVGVEDGQASGGGYRAASQAGQSAGHTTRRAREVSLITYRGPDQGMALITLDGQSQGVVDLYSPAPEYQYTLTYSNLPNTRHTLALAALGLKNPASGGTQVRLDAFAYGATVVEDNQPAASYNGWVGRANSNAYGGAFRATTRADASVSFTLTGARFTWITARGPSSGLAEVIVDGRVVATVDLYHPTREWQYRQVINLPMGGPHSVQIRALGSHSGNSTGNLVVFDGFSVP